MTIKRRLFLSNILMILVPVGATAAVGAVSVRLIWGLLMAGPDVVQRYGQRGRMRQGFSIDLFDGHPFFFGRGEAMMVIVLILLATIIVSILLTNRFLTRFVFRHISEPLMILTNGVEEIGRGNLDHRIHYEGKDEFAPACEAFNEMAVRLKESVEASRENEENRKLLLAGISHDLRSPLTSIRAYTEGLIDGVAVTPESRKQYLNTINQKAEEIDHLVSQVFTYSKMDLSDSDQLLHPTRVDQEIISFLQEEASEYAERGLVLHAELIPVTVEGDAALLKRILSNLSENSLKYKNREVGHLDLALDIIDGDCLITASDDGPGVTDEELEKLFAVFYRSDAARENPAGGSGLGLSITKRCVAQMHGRIWAEHAPGGGLTIRIRLPLVKREVSDDEKNIDHRR